MIVPGATLARPPARAGRVLPLAWQRTDAVGTELVFRSGAGGRSADGAAVVAGTPAYTTHWRAELAPDGAVQQLTVDCRGDGWSRTVHLCRQRTEWTCRAEETGDLATPPPGLADPARLRPEAVLRLADSPIFVSWATRMLHLTPGGGAVTAPSVRVLTPSLAVLPGASTFQLLGEDRLRITGDGPATTCDLDHEGMVTYQRGRFRLVR